MLEDEVVRLAMQVLAAKRPIMRAIELARAALNGAMDARDEEGVV